MVFGGETLVLNHRLSTETYLGTGGTMDWYNGYSPWCAAARNFYCNLLNGCFFGREGAAHRRSREGAQAPWPVVRVRPGAPPRRWPRASTRPRRAVDAKVSPKVLRTFPSECRLQARHARHGEAGDSSQRG